MKIKSAEKMKSGSTEIVLEDGGKITVKEGSCCEASVLLSEYKLSGGVVKPFDPTPSKRRVGKFREFFDFFTDEEKERFGAEVLKNPALNLWLIEAMAGEFSLDNPKVSVGMGDLVLLGVITEERKEFILGSNFKD